MSIVRVYNQAACGEYTLPETGESFSIVLEKSIFHLSEDITVYFHKIGNDWSFSPSSRSGMHVSYKVKNNNEPWFERRIKEGEYLQLINHEDHLLFVFDKEKEIISSLDLYLLRYKEQYKIGSLDESDICVKGIDAISRIHAQLNYVQDHDNSRWVIECRGHNGLYVNNVFCNSKCTLEYGDVIEIFGFKMVILDSMIGIFPVVSSGVAYSVKMKQPVKDDLEWISALGVGDKTYQDSDLIFNPSPRTMVEYENEEIVIEAPPTPNKSKDRSLFMTIGPSLVMVIPMVIGVIIAGTSGAAGLLVTLASAGGMAFFAWKNSSDTKKDKVNDEKLRNEKYREYLQKKEKDIKEKYDFNHSSVYKMYPSAETCLEYNTDNQALWSRNRMQSDYYNIRLGIGTIKNPVTVTIPTERFTLIEDSLAKEPERIKKKYEDLENVPNGINLQEHNLYGVIGSSNECYDVLRILVSQIAANFNGKDMKLVLFCNKHRSEDRELMDDIKWLPHIWSDDNSLRYAGCDRTSAAQVINALENNIKSRERDVKEEKETAFTPHYVFLVAEPGLLEDKTLKDTLYNCTDQIGVTVFVCASDFNDLPNSCEYVIQNTSNFKGFYSLKEVQSKWNSISFDSVKSKDLRKFAHTLSSVKIRTAETAKEIPSSLTFMDMYHVKTVEDLKIYSRWNAAKSDKSLAVPIGIGSGGLTVKLDVHEKGNGVHGLVAGTTGSGKSEVLIDWVLSLAVNYSPEDVSFLLVDFKGGSLVSEFDNMSHHLPHLAGTITNLGGNQIERALVSMHSESLRRQKMLADAGAHDIYEYIRMYQNREVKEPLPHLIIVIDEFAELRAQYPDFLDEIISIGRVGRSLGIHLVLATQTPEGTVDSKITDNMSFYIALRVQTTSGSKSVIGTSDAAYIDEKIKGRAYFKSGANIPRPVQCAWARADYNPSKTNDAEIAIMCNINGATDIAGTHQIQKVKTESTLKKVEVLLKNAESTMAEMKINTRQYLNDARTAEKFNQRMYELLNAAGFNMAPSSENDQRISNLVEVIGICEEKYHGDVNERILYEEASRMRRKLPDAKEKSQLDVIVEQISRIALTNDLVIRNPLWLPELPDELYLKDIPESADAALLSYGKNTFDLEAQIGEFDDPENQYQGQVIMDFANIGNYAVCGSNGTGKSTLLQTLVYSMISSYSPEDLNVYILDFSSHMLECFEGAPHVGGILYETDLDSVGKMFFLLQKILEERKAKLHGGGFAQHRKLGNQMPAILLVIDNIGAFKEKTDNKYDGRILQFCKEGNQYGIYLVMTGSGIAPAEISSKMADNIKGRVCLQMNDTYAYREVLNISGKTITPEINAGRGLIYRNGKALEFQTAIAVKAENEFARSDKIHSFCQRLNDLWHGGRVRTVPRIPKNPVFSEYIRLPEVQEMIEDNKSLPIGYAQASAYPYGLDMSAFFSYLITGPSKQGRTNAMCMLIQSAFRKGGKIYVFGTGTGIVKKIANECQATYIGQNEDLKDFCLEFRDILLKRNRQKSSLEEEGLSEAELYEQMSKNENIFIFIENLVEFTNYLYNPSEGCTKVNGFFETFSEKGWYHQIFIFANIENEKISQVRSYRFYQNVVHDRIGMLFGGNAGNQDLLNFDYLEYRERNEITLPSIGIVAMGDGRMPVGKVVVPTAGK